MILQITHLELDTIDVFRLKGPLTFGQPDLTLRCIIEDLIARGKIRLVVDIGEVSQVDATGCATLLCAEERLRKLGGGLVLVHLRSARLGPVEVGKLEMVFEPFELEQEAVNSFFSDRQVKHLDLQELVRLYRKEMRS